MKSALVIAAALAVCGSAFAAGVVDTVKQDAHQIGSSFRNDLHRIERGDKFREEQAADQRAARHTSAMGAGRAHAPMTTMNTSREERMNAAYANWQRSHR